MLRQSNWRFFGRDTTDIGHGLLFEDNPISYISFLSSSKNPNNPDFFIWSRFFVKKRTLSKTRGGNELYSSNTSGKYIFYAALTRGLQSATKQTIIGKGLEKTSATDSEYWQSTLPHNYLRIALNEWKASVDTGVALHFCCDWGMQSHFRYVWTTLTCTSLPSLRHIVKACFRKVVHL